MSIRRNPLIAAVLALGVVGTVVPAAFAQPAPRPGPERSLNRHMDGRVAFLKAELKITPQQQPAFDAYTRVLRQNADEMDAVMKKRRDARAADTDRKPPTAIEQMERRAEATKLAASQTQRSLDAFKTLYSQLSDEQKKAADELMTRRGRGGLPHRRT
ncbi:MAG: hypothetical protein FJX54_07125 [Alphaproteobacteria bacterium]|nr:hypothetical protein [Alphaproteobacteria bacterium]